MGNLLTIGMATYSDFDGVWFTLQSLRCHHGDDFDIVVVDNSPNGCRRTRDVTLASKGQYLHRPDLAGTSAPRDHLFRVSRTPWTMCLDSHVLLHPGAVAAAIRYAEEHPDSKDIIQGPLVWDNGGVGSTHLRPTHAPGLWGTWDLDNRFIEGEPFEVHSQGLGLFLMRAEAWPGFNPLFRGFGGEEGYIHEKIRQCGGRALCLPPLMWRHRFKEKGLDAPYPLRAEDHVWNLLVGYRELGIDADKQIYDNFGRSLPCGLWRTLVASATRLQPQKQHRSVPRQLKLLGIWYSNNAAPHDLLCKSLESIRAARASSRHKVLITTCSWQPISSNPFAWVLAKRDVKPGHAQILSQQMQCVEMAEREYEWDAVVFLEHDVLYSPGHFDRIGDAIALYPSATVVSNLDYLGLNATGWLAVKERHEPLHQLAVRRDAFFANHDRGIADCVRQGWCNLEPESDRSDWIRLPYGGIAPSVHVNHERRFTSHGEVCYESESSLPPELPFWGDWRKWWSAPPPPVVWTTPATPEGVAQLDCNSAQEAYDALNRHHATADLRVALSGTLRLKEKLLPGVRLFCKEHPEWSVLRHVREGEGLLILTRDPKDKRPLPPLWKRTFNALDATFQYGLKQVAGYGPLLGTEIQEKRLALCILCDSRNGPNCAECGCSVEAMTSIPLKRCLIGNWHEEPHPA